MNSGMLIATFFLLLGSSCLLLIILLVQAQRLALDEARFKLFQLRDDLFSLGVSGEVPFDSNAHLMMRELLNASIRYVHDLTALRLLVGKAYDMRSSKRGRDAQNFHRVFTRAVDELAPEARRKINTIRGLMHYWLVVQMVKRSFVMSAIVGARVLGLVLRRNPHDTHSRATGSLDEESVDQAPPAAASLQMQAIQDAPHQRILALAVRRMKVSRSTTLSRELEQMAARRQPLCAAA